MSTASARRRARPRSSAPRTRSIEKPAGVILELCARCRPRHDSARWIRHGRVRAIRRLRTAFSVARSRCKSVWRQSRGDQVVGGNALMKPRRVDRTRCFRVGDGNRMMVWPRTPRRPVTRHLGDLLSSNTVGVGGRAGLNLSSAARRAVAHELGRHGLASPGEDVFLQPVHQGEVVGEAAEQDHRRVGVGLTSRASPLAAASIDSRGAKRAAIASGYRPRRCPGLDGDRAGGRTRFPLSIVRRHRPATTRATG